MKSVLDRLTELEARVAALEQPAKPAPPQKKRATSMRPDWQPREDEIAFAKDYPNVNEQSERDKFRDYWIQRGEPRLDWNAGYRNWIRRASEYAAPQATRLPSRPTGRAAVIDAENRARKERVSAQLHSLWSNAARSNADRES